MSTMVGLVSHKGGVGKTTFARALALVTTGAGQKVLIADLDFEQQSAFEWAQRRRKANRAPDIQVEVFTSVAEVVARSADFDVMIMDGPARATGMALDIARVADLVVQPSRGTLDDLAPAVRLYHELAAHGIAKSKLVIALHNVLSEREIEEGRDYFLDAGYGVLKGGTFAQRAYGDAQNHGRTILETTYQSLNADAIRIVASVVQKVGEVFDGGAHGLVGADDARSAA